jgi:hypothetical protein
MTGDSVDDVKLKLVVTVTANLLTSDIFKIFWFWFEDRHE